jgi:lysophospholipase L1-like esterase
VRLALLLLLTVPCAAATPRWVGTWATAPIPTENTTRTFATETTLRQTVHVSLGGPRLRVVFTNEFGTGPLAIGAAQAALRTHAEAITFGGQSGAVVPAGAVMVSDPIELKLPALADLTITLLLPAQTVHTFTRHSAAFSTSYEAPGNQLTAAKLTGAHSFTSWLFLKSVEVESNSPNAGAIVAFGDSITDGAHSTIDANARWPDELARRLQASPATAALGVLNEGIGGNRLLHDGTGTNALARFDRDVLAHPNVRDVILLEGINDIGHTSATGTGPEDITAAQLIFAMQQLITRAHAHGIRVYGATLTPYQGAGYASPTGEQLREAVNAFIRAPGNFDGVIDFDHVTQDATHPLAFNPAFDSGDHLHPSDAGYKAMGDAIDWKLFTR